MFWRYKLVFFLVLDCLALSKGMDYSAFHASISIDRKYRVILALDSEVTILLSISTTIAPYSAGICVY